MGSTSRVSRKWDGYILKPIAFCFPQFHAIPENDKFWGPGFTEWDNVRKVTHNHFGVETVRPTEEVGYYNLLDTSVRARHGQLIKDHGLYGIAFHHYWFGRPIMDQALLALLRDGEPDVPFMLSWANEPWTRRWDGNDENNAGGTLLAQEYGGVVDWRKHFDWLLPFFRHPNYIRNTATGHVQFAVYNPSHMGNLGKRMFEAFRLWAAETDGVGGMDIIETRIGFDNPSSRGPADAVSEFGFRWKGIADETKWCTSDRLSRVYHRGVGVVFDNTPRHPSDGFAHVLPLGHPDIWKKSVVESMRRAKLEPNPAGEENFFFVNGLNEWAEGAVLEPSLQWGDAWPKAFKEAKALADSLPWKNELITKYEKLSRELADEVDVVVLIRAFDVAAPWDVCEPERTVEDALTPPKDSNPNFCWDLSHTFRSLQQLGNVNWRAIVVPARKGVSTSNIGTHILNAWDPRISQAEVPNEIMSSLGADGLEAVDWVIQNIEQVAPTLAKAKSFVVGVEGIAYEPDSFDLAGTTDIIGLAFISEATMNVASQGQWSWDQRAERFEDGSTQYSFLMAPDSPVWDIGAAIISMRSWKREGLGLSTDAVPMLISLSSREELPWNWSAVLPVSSASGTLLPQIIYPGTYTAAIRSGRVWVDVPTHGVKIGNEVLRPGCNTAWNVGRFVRHLDYRRYKRSPHCVRLNEETYEESRGE